jgi:hypothetical protein
VEKIQWILDQVKRLAFNLKNIESDEKSARILIFINVLSDATQMCEHASSLSSSADTKVIQDYLFEIFSLRSFLYGSEQMYKECFADSQRMIVGQKFTEHRSVKGIIENGYDSGVYCCMCHGD